MSFTAVIRWRGPDPEVEIETQHPGFETPEEAALFANGIPTASPQSLRLLSDTRIALVLGDGRCVQFILDTVTAWVLRPKPSSADAIVASDNDCCPRPLETLRQLPSTHGDYELAQYGVLEPDGDAVNVTVELAEGARLRVTVDERRQGATPSVFIGSLPES